MFHSLCPTPRPRPTPIPIRCVQNPMQICIGLGAGTVKTFPHITRELTPSVVVLLSVSVLQIRQKPHEQEIS